MRLMKNLIKERLIQDISMIDNKDDLNNIRDYLNFIKEKEEWDATLEILHDKKFMKGLVQGLDDIKKNKISSYESIKKNHKA